MYSVGFILDLNGQDAGRERALLNTRQNTKRAISKFLTKVLEKINCNCDPTALKLQKKPKRDICNTLNKHFSFQLANGSIVPLKYGSRVALKVSWGSKKGQYPAQKPYNV